ncbi:MAG: CrcB family protein [Brevinema sp.]
MKHLLYILSGAIFGGITRELAHFFFIQQESFWNVFGLNILGSFIVGIFSIFIYYLNIKIFPQKKLALIFGFIIGFIIVSTLQLATYVILGKSTYIQSILFSLLTLFCDIIAIGSGIITAFIIIKLT